MELLKSDFFRVSLYLAIISSVFSLSFLDPINWPKQIALVTLIPLILHYSLRGRSQAVKARPAIPILLAIYVASGLTSLLVTQQPMVRELWGTFGRNNGFVTFLCFALLILAGFALGSNPSELPKILWPIQIMSIAAGIYGCFQVLYLDPFKWSQDGQAFAFFGNINFASAIFALGATSSAALLLLNWHRKQQVFLYLIFMSFQLFMVSLTESIQGIIIFAIAISLFLFIIIQKKSQVAAIMVLILSFLAGALVFLSFMGLGPLGDYLYQYTLKLRYFYWLSGVYIGHKYFWFGAGFDSYGDIYREVRPDAVIDMTGIDITVNNAHNTIIQIFATLGVFPAIILLSLYIVAFFKSVMILVTPNGQIEKKVFASIYVPIGVNSLFSIDNISIGIWNHLFLGIALSLLLIDGDPRSGKLSGAESSKTKRIEASTQSSSRTAGLIAGVLGFALAWSSSYPERAIVSAFQVNFRSSGLNQVDPRVNQLSEIGRSSLARDQNFRYIAEGLNTLGQNELAIAALYEGIKRFPKEYQLYDYLAVFLERLNRKEEAVVIREKQISLDPNHPKIWLSLALDLSDLGRKAESLEAFENVVRLQRYLGSDEVGKIEEYRQRIKNA